MLTQYINGAKSDIENLIYLTKQDIEDIKVANHKDIFTRSKSKEDFIKSFEIKKSLLDAELVKKVSSSKNSSVENVLSSQEQEAIFNLKENLSVLHETNKKLAKLVISVTEFYGSLTQRIFPHENDGYSKRISRSASFLETRA